MTTAIIAWLAGIALTLAFIKGATRRGAVVLLACLMLSGCQTLNDWWHNPGIPGPVPGEPMPPEDTSEFPDTWQWVYGSDISGWDKTINLKSAQVNRKAGAIYVVVVDYDRLQNIPAWYVPGDPNNVHNVNGSIWLVREFRGQWYVGTIDYLRVGQRLKEFAAVPEYQVEPRPGEQIGFMVSTCNRAYNGTIVTGDPNSPYRERSNIVWTEWPQ